MCFSVFNDLCFWFIVLSYYLKGYALCRRPPLRLANCWTAWQAGFAELAGFENLLLHYKRQCKFIFELFFHWCFWVDFSPWGHIFETPGHHFCDPGASRVSTDAIFIDFCWILGRSFGHVLEQLAHFSKIWGTRIPASVFRLLFSTFLDGNLVEIWWSDVLKT